MDESRIGVSGRPQDIELTARILQVALEQLARDGFDQLRIERVAAAAGCGKAALYRRWANKAELTAAVIEANMKLGEVPHTGSVVEDLVEYSWRNIQNQATGATPQDRNRLWIAFIQPEVNELYSKSFIGRRREIGRSIIASGIERDELVGNVDGDLILDLLAGLVMYRNVNATVEMTKEELRRAAKALTSNPPLI